MRLLCANMVTTSPLLLSFSGANTVSFRRSPGSKPPERGLSRGGFSQEKVLAQENGRDGTTAADVTNTPLYVAMDECRRAGASILVNDAAF